MRINFFQGVNLKPGYRGTEYQILVLIFKLLESLTKNEFAHAIMELANVGVLDDIVIIKYPTAEYGANIDVISVEASQVKYYEKNFGKAAFDVGGDMAHDKLFIGYLTLKHQFPNADLQTLIYTNTKISDALSTTAAADNSYLNFAEDGWENSCIQGTCKEQSVIPYMVFTTDDVFKTIKDKINSAGLDRLLSKLTTWEGIIDANGLSLQGDITNFIKWDASVKAEDRPVSLQLVNGRIPEHPAIAEKSIKRLNDIYTSRNNGMPKVINFKRQATADLTLIPDNQWEVVEVYFKNTIRKNNLPVNFTSEIFVTTVKSVLAAKQRYNANIEETLTEFRAKTQAEKQQLAQGFLANLRIYKEQPSFQIHYNKTLDLLVTFRQSLAEGALEEFTTDEKNKITFAYIFNKVRLWFTKTYPNHEVPTLNRETLAEWITTILNDQIIWKQYGESKQLIVQIHDHVGQFSLLRTDIKKQLNAEIAREGNGAIVLLGEAGIGKSVLAKICWSQWQGTKFFFDLHQKNVIGRRNELYGKLEDIPPSLILIDRAERITDPGAWQAFFTKCQENNHKLLLITRRELIEMEIAVKATVVVPELTDGEIKQLNLPEFIYESPDLMKLCKLPFFCRLAFDIDETQLNEPTPTREHFVKTAIIGAHTLEYEQKQRLVIWQALCTSMLNAQGHISVEAPEEIQNMPEFEALCKADIIIQEGEKHFKFMHDIFFEVGLFYLLERSIDNSVIEQDYQYFEGKVCLCLQNLSPYDFSLLLPWFHQHQKQLQSSSQMSNKLTVNDMPYRIPLALMQEGITEEALTNTLKAVDLSTPQYFELFQGKSWSLIELAIYFNNFTAFLYLSKSELQNSPQVLRKCCLMLEERGIPETASEKEWLIKALYWLDQQLQRTVTIKVQSNEEGKAASADLADDTDISSAKQVVDFINLSNVLTFDLAIELMTKTHGKLDFLVGHIPFTIKELHESRELILKYSFEVIDVTLTKMLQKHDCLDNPLYDLINDIISLIDLGPYKPSLNLTRETLAAQLVEDFYIVESTTDALEIIEYTELEVDNFNGCVPFNTDHDFSVSTDDVIALSKSSFEDNWERFLDADSEIVTFINDVLGNEAELITELVSQFYDNGAIVALELGFDDNDIMNALSDNTTYLDNLSEVKSFSDQLYKIDPIVDFYKCEFKFDPDNDEDVDLLVKDTDFVLSLCRNNIGENLNQLRDTFRDNQDVLKILDQHYGAAPIYDEGTYAGGASPRFFAGTDSGSMSLDSTERADHASFAEYLVNHSHSRG